MDKSVQKEVLRRKQICYESINEWSKDSQFYCMIKILNFYYYYFSCPPPKKGGGGDGGGGLSKYEKYIDQYGQTG